MTVQKPLSHWLFADLPPKEKPPPEERRVCVGLTREEGRRAELAIRGVLHSREFKPHLKDYFGLMGMEKVSVNFVLTSPTVSKWAMLPQQAPTNLNDIYRLLAAFSVKLSQKGMGICEVEVHPHYAPASPHTPENITGWYVNVTPSWIREAVPHQTLERELDAKLRPLIYVLTAEETGRLADYFIDKLREAGISLPTQFKGEFEKALNINKSYEENKRILDKVIADIAGRERREKPIPHEEWFKARKFEALAVGKNWKPPMIISISRPPSTDPKSIGRLIKIIREGQKDAYQDYSTKALVYSESDYMYYIIEGAKPMAETMLKRMRSPWQAWIQPILTWIIDQQKIPGMVRREDVYKEWMSRGATREEIDKAIGQLLREGTLYSPREGFLRTT